MEALSADRTPLPSGRRTLVVAPNWVGDLVMAEPVFRALAATGREVTALVRKPLLPLARLVAPQTFERHADPKRAAQEIAAERFDEAVILPNSFRSAWLAAQAGIPRRYGYRGDFRSPLLAPAIRRPSKKRPQIEDYRELLEAMGVPPPSGWIPQIGLPDSVRRAGHERLVRAKTPPGPGPLVGLFPGAEWGQSKRWPWRRFAALATELRRRIPGVRVVVLVGPKEVWLGVRVFEESAKVHPVIGPDLDLAGLAGVLSHLDLMVTNDSGPMHLAAALGVPTVALFGPTDPRRTAPAGDGHTVLYRDLWCSPCFRRRCPLLHHGCLRGIRVAQAADAALTALERA